jgi:hypothetical protein
VDWSGGASYPPVGPGRHTVTVLRSDLNHVARPPVVWDRVAFVVE